MVLVGVMTLAVFASTVITPWGTAFAATSSSSPNLDSQVQAWWYYNAAISCMDQVASGNGGGLQTDEADVKSGNWFTTSLFANTGGYYMKNALSSMGSDGGNGCSQGSSTVLANTFKMWGVSPVDVACASGIYTRADGSNCVNGHNDFKTVSFADIQTDFKAYAKSTVYHNAVPSLSDADRYLFYEQTFLNGCANGATALSTASAAESTGQAINSESSQNYGYEIAEPSGTGVNATMKKVYYSGQESGDTSVNTYPASWSHPSFGTKNATQETCAYLAKQIADPNGSLALAYKAAARSGANVTPPKTCSDGSSPDSNGKCPTPSDQTSCNIPSLGWILCPILSTGAQLADSAYGFLAQNFLVTNPSLVNMNPNATTQDADGQTQKVGTGAFTAWKIMVQIADVVFVIVFLIIIFSQLTNAGVNNYGVKKLLPRLIIAAILVNTSFFICAICIDVSNILGYSLKNVLTDVANQVASSNGGTAIGTSNGALSGANSLMDIVGGIITGAAAATVVWVNLGAVIVAMVAALLVLLTIFVLLAARQALIVLLVVVSPLAFVAYLLPNTESWFTKWRKMLTSLLMLFPIIGLLYGACQLASEILLKVAGDNVVMRITAYMALVIPLIAVIPLLKGSLDGVGKLGASIQNWGKKAQKTGRKATQKAYDNSRVGQFKAYRSNRWAQRRAQIQAGTQSGRGGKANPLNWLAGINSGLNAASGRFGAKLSNQGAALAEREDKELLDNAGARLDAMTFTDMSHAAVLPNGTVVGATKAPLTQAQLMQIATGQDVTDSTGKVVASASKFKEHDRRAAIERATKNASVQEAHQLVDYAGSGKMGLTERKALASALPGSKVATKAPYLGGKTLSEIAQGTSNSTTAAREALLGGKITAEALAGMDKDSVNHLIQIAQNTTANSAERNALKSAYAQLSAPNSRLGEKIVAGGDHDRALQGIRSL